MKRRAFLHFLASTAVAPAVSPVASAQAYPSRPVTLVVFVPAGGTPDIIARLLGQSLSQRLGQSVVIDNRPGGGGNVALQAVARAPADGYTLLLVATPHAVNVTLYEKSTATVTRDIAPVASINTDSFVLMVNPSFPATTVAELITYAKTNPGKINLASSGTGNLSHLSGELFRMMTGVEVVHVPYRGTPAAHSGLMAGDVHAMFDATASALPHIQSGALRALGVTASARAGASGRPADRGRRPRLCRDRLARHRRPQGHAGRNRRAAQPRYQRGASRCRGEDADGGPWQRFAFRLCPRVCPPHCGRNREMGEGGQVRRPQGGVKARLVVSDKIIE
jgi:tripartite-type tricarboxylate transporter receptor subunit TctC